LVCILIFENLYNYNTQGGIDKKLYVYYYMEYI